MGDREVKQPPAGHFWKQKTDVPDHAKQEGNYWVGPPREHSVRFPGLTLVVAFQRPRCCMEQRVTHWEVLTGTVGSEAQVGPHGRASLPSITSAPMVLSDKRGPSASSTNSRSAHRSASVTWRLPRNQRSPDSTAARNTRPPSPHCRNVSQSVPIEPVIDVLLP